MSIADDPRERERADLHSAGVEAFPHIPDLADRWLEELSEDGSLPDAGGGLSIGGRQVVRPVSENPANRSKDPQVSHAVLDNGQTLWLRRSARRFLKGYRGVGVVERPDRTTQAVLAALANLEGRKIEPKRLAECLPYLDPSDATSITDSLFARFEELRLQGNMRAACDAVLADRSLQYAHALLRYYRPDFDSRPEQEKLDLLEGCCERINKVLDSTRHLTAFLEYGAPKRDQRPAVENAPRDVEAAILRDVERLKYREIADELGVEAPERPWGKDYSTIGKMVKRGRDILERAYGLDGWDELAERMRTELAEWKSLSDEERRAELSSGLHFRAPQS